MRPDAAVGHARPGQGRGPLPAPRRPLRPAIAVRPRCRPHIRRLAPDRSPRQSRRARPRTRRRGGVCPGVPPVPPPRVTPTPFAVAPIPAAMRSASGRRSRASARARPRRHASPTRAPAGRSGAAPRHSGGRSTSFARCVGPRSRPCCPCAARLTPHTHRPQSDFFRDFVDKQGRVCAETPELQRSLSSPSKHAVAASADARAEAQDRTPKRGRKGKQGDDDGAREWCPLSLPLCSGAASPSLAAAAYAKRTRWTWSACSRSRR